jgi:hypothetical protein
MAEQAEAAPEHRTLGDRLTAWFPAVVTMGVMLVVAAYFAVPWPDAPTMGNGVVVEGLIVTVDHEANTIQYGYPVGGGPRLYKTVVIGEERVNPAYRWRNIASGSRLRVVYDPTDPQVSIPFLDFPVWTMGSWATLIGFVVAVIAVWIRKRWLTKEPE